MKPESMKIGDYVDVHFRDGCRIGQLRAIETDTVTVEFDNSICEGIPKEIVTTWVSV